MPTKQRTAVSDEFAALLPPAQECSDCHQVDDHPKHHYGDRRYHFDCLPADVYDDSFGHLKGAEKKRIDTLIAHARADGVPHKHGHELRAWHIINDPNQPDEHKRAARKVTTNG